MFADLAPNDTSKIDEHKFSESEREIGEKLAYELCVIFNTNLDGKKSMNSYVSSSTYPLPIQSVHDDPQYFTSLFTNAIYKQLEHARDAKRNAADCILLPLYKKIENILEHHSFNQKKNKIYNRYE